MAETKIPEMVERVARAISAERWNRPEQFDMESDAWRDAHRDMARAAIAAMREQTEAMTSAADAEANRYYGNAHELLFPDHAWRIMIDAALGG